MSVPDTPSTMQWWILEISAQRLPGSPSTNHISHNGRLRSSSCDISRPIRLSRSCSVLRGGNAE